MAYYARERVFTTCMLKKQEGSGKRFCKMPLSGINAERGRDGEGGGLRKVSLCLNVVLKDTIAELWTLQRRRMLCMLFTIK